MPRLDRNSRKHVRRFGFDPKFIELMEEYKPNRATRKPTKKQLALMKWKRVGKYVASNIVTIVVTIIATLIATWLLGWLQFGQGTDAHTGPETTQSYTTPTPQQTPSSTPRDRDSSVVYL